MLLELKEVRQIKGEGVRRWFSDRDLDLIVWYETNKIIGFQLCYDKSDNERALTWYKKHGFIHTKIDDGESSISQVRNKMSPILVSDGIVDKTFIADQFKEKSQKLNIDLADFIHTKILEYR